MPDEKPLNLEPRTEPRYDPLLDAAAQVARDRDEELEEAARAIDRAARRRTLLLGAVVVAVVLLLSAVVAVVTTRRSSPSAVAVGSDAFSADGLAVPGAVSAQWSPDGNRLAVLRGGGAFGVSEAGRFRPLVPAEATISAFAWYDDGRLLLQEGPVSTGQLAAIDLQGESKGVVKLVPDVQPGTGMAVSRDRRTVILTGVVEGATPGSQPTVDLYAVAVPDGTTRRLTENADAESRPAFLDDRHVAFTNRRDGAEQVQILDLDDGTRVSVSTPTARAAVIGVAGGDVVWTTGDEVRLGRAGAPEQRVASVPSGATAVALSPERTRLVVRDASPDGDTILRLIRL
jgi:hypothetical protein